MSAEVAVVRAAFESYQAQDRDAAIRLYANDFVFTSPQDDHIDKDAYFERCFPTFDRLRSQQILQLVDSDRGLVFAYYEYELATGGTYRNVRRSPSRDGLIHEVQVFFGGQVLNPS